VARDYGRFKRSSHVLDISYVLELARFERYLHEIYKPIIIQEEIIWFISLWRFDLGIEINKNMLKSSSVGEKIKLMVVVLQALELN